ncbi:peptidylprolyl isomerase, partial [Eubacteriales bacterium OttesenSCG-928-A19]|nr:peptidylprolyl isomerase [Eubacteriales bacterium OttesenSCG-928-A19]
MIRLTGLVMALVMMLSLATGAQAEAGDSVYEEGSIQTTDAEHEKGDPIFVITLEDGGELRGELYPDIAPASVANFIALANSGYYDGLTFHRVIPGFMIQGGDPLGNGTGGPGWQIKGEFSSNGWENSLKHTYGVLSMARSGMPDSAGSQFFIMVSDSPSLDGDYAAFGLVTEGMEHAD